MTVTAYDLALNVSAFQWIGEPSGDLEVFHKMFQAAAFSQTPQHVLRVRVGGRCTEVPIGYYVIVPEHNLDNLFVLNKHIWRNSSSGVGGINYNLELQNCRLALSQDYTERELDKILHEIDKKSFVEMSKSRFFCNGRYIGLESEQAIIYATGFVFTLQGAFCQELIKENKLVFKDKQVVINDASVILIRTDATIIVDASKECSIVRRDLSDYTTGSPLIVDYPNKETLEKSDFRFNLTDSSTDVTKVMLSFLQHNKDAIMVSWNQKNKRLMLKYITDSINTMLARTGMIAAKQVATHMRINTFTFDAFYRVDSGEIVLV